MADSKITDLASLPGTSAAAADSVPVVDVSDPSMATSGTTKKIALSELATALTNLAVASNDVALRAWVTSQISQLSFAQFGVYVGPTPPLNPVTYQQWLLNPASGFWGYIQADSLLPGNQTLNVSAAVFVMATGAVTSISSIANIQVPAVDFVFGTPAPTVGSSANQTLPVVAADFFLVAPAPQASLSVSVAPPAVAMPLVAVAPTATLAGAPAGTVSVQATSVWYEWDIDTTGQIVAIPAGLANNDIVMIVAFGGDFAGHPISTPAGYTAVSPTGTANGWRLFWKRTTGSESNPTLSSVGQGSQTFAGACARVYVLRGCATAVSPIDAATLRNNASSTTITGSAITTAVNNEMRFLCGGGGDGSGFPAPSNCTFSAPANGVDTINTHYGGTALDRVFVANEAVPSNTAGVQVAPTATCSAAFAAPVLTFAARPP